LHCVSLQSRRGIPECAGACLDDVLVLLLCEPLGERGSLHRAELAADADLTPVIHDRLGDIGVGRVAIIETGIEAIRIASGSEQLLRLGRVVLWRWRLPVELEP